MDYLEQLKRQALSKVNGVFYGANAGQQMDQAKLGALQAATTKWDAGSGLRPTRNAFMRVNNTPTWETATVNSPSGWASQEKVQRNNYGLAFDQNAWATATQNWMRGQADYKDWTDAQIAQYVADTAGMTDQQAAARELWMSQKVAFDKATADAQADRNRMLAELETFKAGISQAWIDTTLSQEKTYWDDRTARLVDNTIKQVAAMGRVANPYMLSQTTRNAVAQSAVALQTRRNEMEQTRQTYTQWYLTQLNGVFQNTQRTTMDINTAAGLVAKAGAAAA